MNSIGAPKKLKIMPKRFNRLLLTFAVIVLLLFFALISVLNQKSSVLVEDSPCMTHDIFTQNVRNICQRKDITVLQKEFFKNRNSTAIPKRLHQTFGSVHIPTPYHDHIRSWIVNHPDWEYYFWTDEDAERMIRERYPKFIQLFENYTHRLLKSDAIRYFILHQYGGVYFDMDMQSLKPIEPFLKSNTCIVVTEPHVQTQMIYNLTYSLTNCIMASTDHHPYLEFILDSLEAANRPIKENWDILYATGPFLINRTYDEYLKKYPWCVSGTYCHVYKSDFKYLVPTYERESMIANAKRCRSIAERRNLGKLQIEACKELITSKFYDPIPKEAYANHLWLHLGWYDQTKLTRTHIENIVPGAITYDLLRHR